MRSFVLGEPPGTLMAAGPRHVVAFFRAPKLISLENGEVLHRWEGLFSGTQASSICRTQEIPPLALDPARARFAVAHGGRITAVRLDLDALAKM